jgi:hypothetical protein
MKTHARCALALSLALAPPVSAAPLNTSEPMTCAARQIIACDADGQCGSAAGEPDSPTFLKVSIADKSLSETRKDGETHQEEIDNVKTIDDRLVMHGNEGKIAWNLAIVTSTGHMTLTASGDEIGFVIFGHCTGR